MLDRSITAGPTPYRDRAEIGPTQTDAMSSRGRIVLLVVVVVFVGGLVAWHAVRDDATPPGTVTARTDDGHLRFRIPDSWEISDCLSPSDSCVQAGPPGGAALVTVMVVPDDPDATEANPALLIFSSAAPSPDPSGWIRSTVSGHRAVRVEDAATPVMVVLLDEQGDTATVRCANVAYVKAADAGGCRLVMDTLHIDWP
jgi:hypothetical protein